MKALTILNPFPAYILLPASDPLHKRVENRGWATPYRGQLLIHAGQSKAMLDPDECYDDLELQWGAIVGVCELVDCVRKDSQRYPWLATHSHAHGPVCWVLDNIRRFPEPVRCRGAQGMWNVTGVPLVNVREQLAQAVAV